MHILVALFGNTLLYFVPVGLRSIVSSVYVCPFVC